MNSKLELLLVILVGLALGIPQRAEAQQLDKFYLTTHGSIYIMATYADSSLIASSNEVTVLMDYETANFRLFFDLSSLCTGVDSLDIKLDEEVNQVVEYDGKLGLDYVPSLSHGRQEFSVEGYLNCVYECGLILGRGTLEHLQGKIYPCLLNLTFIINKEQLPYINLPGELGNELHVEVIQKMLQREGN